MKEKPFLDLCMESSILAFPVVYLALVMVELDGVPAISALGGLVFFGGVIIGPLLLGLVVAIIRAGIRH
jgi:hypothetical protein